MDKDGVAVANFSANLKLASSYHPSISALCRKLEINRQQYMKYLSGGSFPSRRNMRRICDFFGVDEFEILMPPDQFDKLVSLRPVQASELPPVLGAIPKFLTLTQRQRGLLARTLGYYYEYYFSFSTPRHILRTLVQIYAWDEYTLYKRIERLRRDDQVGPPDVYKYDGVATVVGDRIYLFDYEAITGAELSQTVLFLNYRNRITNLSGLRMGVAGSEAHEPSVSRVVMEYIGRSVSRRDALAGCQLYQIDSDEVPRAIREHLTIGGRVAGPLRGAVV